ncbi:tryptophan-rich sensory protein [Bacillus mangrovi]|uniref:Tryptophan-rich sensory protein n=1 Tax=Metabacillus mangrovi TaxID=1491830 RepID=A0A7X2S709_9BACI|nr:TspO/MBR family protein [Metabacillus mangrovi]MTH54401.1 tryptophan-rich sensory protein [Metabacillus mangrovi]
MLRSIFIFVITYALFSISGFLFRVDESWYDALNKPEWTPAGGTIGIIWSVLFALIAAALVIIDRKSGGLNKLPPAFWIVLIVNYLSNQLFSYFQFSLKNLGLATADCAVVAVTAILLAVMAFKMNKAAGILLIPYVLWTSFATYLSYTIYSMNL